MSLSDSVYEELLARIVRCHYAPGSLLSEDQLVHELNASRTPIRAALIRLQQDNLVRIIPKKGILVTPITPDSVRDLYNLRDLVELYAIRNYGQNFRKDRLLAYLNDFAPPKEENNFTQIFDADVLFHIEIVSLTGNEILNSYYRSMQYHLTRITRICGEKLYGRLSKSNNEHRSIIMPLLQDDLEAAEEALRIHLKQARNAAYSILLAQPEN